MVVDIKRIQKRLREQVTLKNLVKLINNRYNPQYEDYKNIFIVFNIETMNLEARTPKELTGKFVIIMVFSELIEEGLNRNDFTFKQFLKASYNEDIMLNYIKENF